MALVGYYKSHKHHSRNHKHWKKLRILSVGSIDAAENSDESKAN